MAETFASTVPDDIRDRLNVIEHRIQKANSIASGWTRGGLTYPSVDLLQATHAQIANVPIKSGTWTASSQSIAQGSTVVFSSVAAWNNTDFSYDSTINSWVPKGSPTLQLLLLVGSLDWSTNSSGARTAHLYFREYVAGVASTTDIILQSAVSLSSVLGTLQGWKYPIRLNSSFINFAVGGWQNGKPSDELVSARFSIIHLGEHL